MIWTPMFVLAGALSFGFALTPGMRRVALIGICCFAWAALEWTFAQGATP